MHVLVGRMGVRLPHLRSLKEKRSVRLHLIGRLKRHFPAAGYAELEAQDEPGHLVMGIVLVGSSPSALERTMEQIRSLCEQDVEQPIRFECEFR